MLDLPPLPRRLLSLLVRPFSPILSSRLSPAPPASALDVWRLNAEAAAAADGTLRAWRAAGVDAVLCNGCPMPAAPAGMADRLFDTFNLGCGFNLINFPAGTVRVIKKKTKGLFGRKMCNVYNIIILCYLLILFLALAIPACLKNYVYVLLYKNLMFWSAET